MYRLLKPKNINRAVVLLALLAPILYLFGTQFTALAGAHGEEVIAQEPYQDEWVETDSFSGTHDYKFVFYETFDFAFPSTRFDTLFDFTCNSASFYGVRLGDIGTGQTQYIAYLQVRSVDTTYAMGVHRNASLGWSGYPDNATLYFSSASLPSSTLLQYGTLYYKNEVAVTSYYDSLFGDMFGKSNFLSEWGEDALSENRAGFAPIGQFFTYIDDYAFHVGDTQIGKMGYGYAYYAAHVLLFDLLVYFATFFFRIIKDVVDRLEVSK